MPSALNPLGPKSTYINLNDSQTSLHSPRLPASPGAPSSDPYAQGGNGYFTPPNPFRDSNDSFAAPPRGTSLYRDSTSTGTSVEYGGTAGIMTGLIGSGYGPYARDGAGNSGSPNGSYQNLHDSQSIRSQPRATTAVETGGGFEASTFPDAALSSRPLFTARDAILDDKLHNPQYSSNEFTVFSLRGWLNMAAVILLFMGLVFIFAGLPIVRYIQQVSMSNYGAVGLGGINGSGQVPKIEGLPNLIDVDTPESALTRTGFDGKKYLLQFSDEFNVDGRTFEEGMDPFWEAVNLHYWATEDYEWYDPDAAITKDGSLQLTITEQPTHGLNFRSGMLQSWNKFCFTSGYIEIRVQFPGYNDLGHFWPGAWTLGNLVRAGYGATSDGLWPYSYDTCDVGTLPNQTNVAGTGPAAALNSGDGTKGGALSYLPGQRLSACTCPKEDHPGPRNTKGRGGPEIDIIEAQMVWREEFGMSGGVSQSAQFAPYDAHWQPKNTTPHMTVYNETKTWLNEYIGGVLQQAVSGITLTDPAAYEMSEKGFETYGFESWAGDGTNGYVTWMTGDQAVWAMNASAVGPNAATQIGQRIISQEPMPVDWSTIRTPAKMLIDYVRVYQIAGEENIGCDPKEMPTSKYIQDHINAYSNPNLTTWAQAGYEFPRNSLDGC